MMRSPSIRTQEYDHVNSEMMEEKLALISRTVNTDSGFLNTHKAASIDERDNKL